MCSLSRAPAIRLRGAGPRHGHGPRVMQRQQTDTRHIPGVERTMLHSGQRKRPGDPDIQPIAAQTASVMRPRCIRRPLGCLLGQPSSQLQRQPSRQSKPPSAPSRGSSPSRHPRGPPSAAHLLSRSLHGLCREALAAAARHPHLTVHSVVPLHIAGSVQVHTSAGCRCRRRSWLTLQQGHPAAHSMREACCPEQAAAQQPTRGTHCHCSRGHVVMLKNMITTGSA